MKNLIHYFYTKSLFSPIFQYVNSINNADIIAHFIVGLFVSLFLFLFKINNKKIFLITLFIAIFKELLDIIYSGNISTIEHSKDIIVTISPFVIIYTIKYRNKFTNTKN